MTAQVWKLTHSEAVITELISYTAHMTGFVSALYRCSLTCASIKRLERHCRQYNDPAENKQAEKCNSPSLLSHLWHRFSPVLNSRLFVLRVSTFLHLEVHRDRVCHWKFITTQPNTPVVPWWRMCWSLCHVLMLWCCSLLFFQAHFSVAITGEMLGGWWAA